jgi:hypothetical protein
MIKSEAYRTVVRTGKEKVNDKDSCQDRKG